MGRAGAGARRLTRLSREFGASTSAGCSTTSSSARRQQRLQGAARTVAWASQDFRRLSDLMTARPRLGNGRQAGRRSRATTRMPDCRASIASLSTSTISSAARSGKVVDVLEAVHFLLAYPLFVAVRRRRSSVAAALARRTLAAFKRRISRVPTARQRGGARRRSTLDTNLSDSVHPSPNGARKVSTARRRPLATRQNRPPCRGSWPAVARPRRACRSSAALEPDEPLDLNPRRSSSTYANAMFMAKLYELF